MGVGQNERRSLVSVGFVLVMSAVLLALLAAPPANAATITLSGYVMCRPANGAVQPVTGVWVESSAGGSKWASWGANANRRQQASYSVSLTTSTSTTSVRLHVGCGGTPSAWWSNNRSNYYSVTSGSRVDVICTPYAGAGDARCTRTQTVGIGMPFTGWWDRFGYAPPSSHGDNSAGSLPAPYDWATDIYQGAGTAVKAIANASGVPQSSIRLTVYNRSNTSCGTRLELDVSIYETHVGRVKYSHLTGVPGWAKGTLIPSGTTIGNLNQWPYSSCWQVTTANGVHTHFAAGNVNNHGYACYHHRGSGSYLPEGTHVGWVGTTRAWTSKQAC
jgi:hypothetical protein